MDIIKMIEKYNLSIRRIPDEIVEVNEFRHYKPGDEVFEQYGRKFVRRSYKPKNAGYYMCKSVNNNMSTIQWNSNKDNLSDTLEGSIQKFLNSLK